MRSSYSRTLNIIDAYGDLYSVFFGDFQIIVYTDGLALETQKKRFYLYKGDSVEEIRDKIYQIIFEQRQDIYIDVRKLE